MPFLRDEGPPIPQASIQKLRETLPVDYGWQLVNETGREVLAVRVPKPKPDYLHDLSEVAFYVGLETIRNTKDILLIGHEKTARLEPQLLRDHIRAQGREDATVVDHLRRQLDRQYGHTFVVSPSNHQHSAFAVRIPKETVAQFMPEDVNAIRQLVSNLRPRVMECQYAYVVSNSDHERLGRRTLLELIGDAAASEPAQAAASDAAPAASVFAPAATAPAAPRSTAPAATAAAFPFSALPATTPAAAPAQPIAAPAAHVPPPRGTPSFIAAAMTATPAPGTQTTPAPAAEVDITEHEEYTIVSKPKVVEPVAAAPVPPPSHRLGLEGAEVVHDEYEVVSKPKAVHAPAEPIAAPEPARHDDGRHVLRGDSEFEVFTSKPKPRTEAPSITPPGMGGFQAALAAGAGQAPSRTKEYEIIGRTSVTSDPSIAAKMRLPSASGPAPVASPFAAASPPPAAAPPMQSAPLPPIFHTPPAVPLPPRVAVPSAPSDSGAPVIVRTAPASPELILASRFKESGYEVVEGLRAQGTTFAFAAHKPNGRRVLVKRTDSFAPEDAATLAQLVAALGADVALVVADQVRPGTRLATWGTRIEVVTPADVPDLSF